MDNNPDILTTRNIDSKVGFQFNAKKTNSPLQSGLLASKSHDEASDKSSSRSEMLKRVADLTQTTAQMQHDAAKQQLNAALEEDPTIFDYDDIYEELQPNLISNTAKKTGNAKYGYGITVNQQVKLSSGSSSLQSQSIKNKPQSQYINGLLSKARDRKFEMEMAREKQLHLENEKYESKHGKTESFVTPEYMQKLEEDKKRREEEEKQSSGRSGASGMLSFCSNLRRSTFSSSETAMGDEEESKKTIDKNAVDMGAEDSQGSRGQKRDSSHLQQFGSLPSALDDKRNPSDDDNQPSIQSTSANLISSDEVRYSDVSHSKMNPPPAKRAHQSLIGPTPKKPRRHTQEMIEEAKKRYFLRKAARKNESQSIVEAH